MCETACRVRKINWCDQSKHDNYDILTEQALREELMKKDIEIARLKRLCSERWGQKAYDTIPD